MMTSLMYKPGAVEWAMLAVLSHTLFMTAKPQIRKAPIASQVVLRIGIAVLEVCTVAAVSDTIKNTHQIDLAIATTSPANDCHRHHIQLTNPIPNAKPGYYILMKGHHMA